MRLWLLLFMTALCLMRRPAAAEATNAPVKDLGDGRLQIGLVTLDGKSKTVTIPASVNMRTGLVEYALVTTYGKVHESVFKTDAEPFHIQAAVLLLGAKLETNSDTAIFFDSKRQIPGPALRIDILLPDSPAKSSPIDHFLLNATQKSNEGLVPRWIYNGSRFSNGVFLAQREGSIISLIADPAALINNPREDRENDELWSANPAVALPPETPVQIRFTLLTSDGKR